MISENRIGELYAQLLLPKWGTTGPVTFQDIAKPIYDTSGRPVQERKELNIADVPFDYVPGLPDGNRDLFFVNISAYKEIISVWPEALGIISHLRNMVQSYDSKITAGGIESALNTANALPVWQAFRADGPTRAGKDSDRCSRVPQK